MITFNEYKNALSSSARVPLVKIEWMDSDEIIIDEIITDTLSGNINMQYVSGLRRDCSVSLQNIANKYIPDVDGYIYLNTKFKLSTGLEINGEEYWNSQGIFNIGNPKISREEVANKVNIEGYDNFALLNGTISGELEDDYIIPVGTTITNAVKAIFTDAGIIKSPIIYPTSEILPYTITKQAGENYAELLKELAYILSWMVYFDADGYPRFEPSVDEITTSPVDILDSNSIISHTHEYQYDSVKNNIIVYGDNINGNLAKGTAQDDGLFSNTSIKRIGKRTDQITDANIYSDSLAQQRADYELKMSIQLYENDNTNIIPKDYLTEGMIILIDDESSGFNRTPCLIKKISLDIDFNGTQSLNLWKVRDI